jgi:hypothetical protein
MMKQAVVWVKTRFTGFHRWKDAPDDVAYLRDWHRHEFHVKVYMPVCHLNRDIEFHTLKLKVEGLLTALHYMDKRFEESCEQIAEHILEVLHAYSVEVSEDGENGAVVWDHHAFPSIGLNIEQPPPGDMSPEEREKIKEEIENFQGRRLMKEATTMMDEIEQKILTTLLSERVRDKCFVGIEAEGPHRGTKTLFIPYEFPWKDLPDVINKIGTMNFDQVYLGAGNKPVYGRCGTWLREVAMKLPTVPMTIEVKVDDVEPLFEIPKVFIPGLDNTTVRQIRQVHAERAEHIFSHLPPLIRPQWVKWTEGGWIKWQKLGDVQTIETRVDDPLFAQDKEI